MRNSNSRSCHEESVADEVKGIDREELDRREREVGSTLTKTWKSKKAIHIKQESGEKDSLQRKQVEACGCGDCDTLKKIKFGQSGWIERNRGDRQAIKSRVSWTLSGRRKAIELHSMCSKLSICKVLIGECYIVGSVSRWLLKAWMEGKHEMKQSS